MKHKLFNNIITTFTLCILGTLNAQKFDKKYTENFKVNKDVEVVINASNTDINVTTWNKNEVQINAFIEVEGITKDEAEKYFKNWNFEALGNSKTVKITSKNDHHFGSGKDFIIFNDMDFTFPDIQMPDFDAIVIPDMDFDFDFDFDFENIFEDLDDLDKNMGKDGKYSFQWNDGVDKITIKSKKEWEAFKKTKKYRELREKMKVKKKEMSKKFVISKEKLKKQFEKAKIEIKQIDKEKIRKSIANAKEKLKKMKFNFSTNSKSGTIIIDGKEIKIKKRLEIKVPKKAIFDLNTRHCKVKLPNTVASGNVKYGSFDANNLIGGKLTIDYSNVKINDLNACNLFLNNVTDAKIASVTNTILSNNSCGVKIIKINENVNISDKFGELRIVSFNPNFGKFNLNLINSEAILNLSNLSKIDSELRYNGTVLTIPQKTTNNQNSTIFNSSFNVHNKNKTIIFEGKNSKLTFIN